MFKINTSLVKELRARTGVGIMECKKALITTKGDIESAIDHLRKLGKSQAAKKAIKITTEGIILTKIRKDKKYAVILEINCESDFVAKNRDFKLFSDQVITTALNKRINQIDELKSIFDDQRTDLISKMGENINISKFSFLEGDLIVSYLHGIKIGVIIAGTKNNPIVLKNIAMHIAANNPEYLNQNDIPSEVLNREYNIQYSIAVNAKKNYEITKKIVEGRMINFKNNLSLLNQVFIMDTSKTIKQLLTETNTNISNFIRFELGQNIKLH